MNFYGIRELSNNTKSVLSSVAHHYRQRQADRDFAEHQRR